MAVCATQLEPSLGERALEADVAGRMPTPTSIAVTSAPGGASEHVDRRSPLAVGGSIASVTPVG